jgi:uncharacterized coiled-coil protein SlyX
MIVQAFESGGQMRDAITTRRLKVHRILTLTMFLGSLLGWSAFAYSSHSAAVAWRGLREAIAKADADRTHLIREHAGALAEARAQIENLERQLRLATTKFEEATPDVPETGSVRPSRPRTATQRPTATTGSTKATRASGPTLTDLLKED